MGGVKEQIMILFKSKDYSQPKHVKTVYRVGKKSSKSKIQEQSEDKIIKNIRNRFKLKGENKAIKDRILRDIKTLFEQKEDKSDRNKNLSVKKYLNEIKP